MGALSDIFASSAIFNPDINMRNLAVAYVSGCLFATGWWFIFDICAIFPENSQFLHVYHTIGVFSTLALVMIVMPQEREDGGLFCGPMGSRFLIFSGFVIGFTCVIAATWIMFQEYVAYKEHTSAWPGVALFLQNSLIFSAALAYKMGRVDGEYMSF